MDDVDTVSLLAREVLRERAATLVAEACAWSVGLSDTPHFVRRHDRVIGSGVTLGVRAATGLQLASEQDGRLELANARPGSFQDALDALDTDGRLHAARFDEQVLEPFVLDACVLAAERFRSKDPPAWAELLDELGEDGSDLGAVVRAAEWEAPLRIEAEQLALAALGHVPIVEVEAEGLALSLVRAAEDELRRAAGGVEPDPCPADSELAGALFLAVAALADATVPVPVPPAHADELVELLLAEGLEDQEVMNLLPHLPVLQDTAERVTHLLRSREGEQP